MNSPFETANPSFLLWHWPWLSSWRTTTACGNNSRTTGSTGSLEPSSITTISSESECCCRTSSRVRRSSGARSRVAIITLTRGRGISAFRPYKRRLVVRPNSKKRSQFAPEHQATSGHLTRAESRLHQHRQTTIQNLVRKQAHGVRQAILTEDVHHDRAPVRHHALAQGNPIRVCVQSQVHVFESGATGVAESVIAPDPCRQMHVLGEGVAAELLAKSVAGEDIFAVCRA